MDSKQFIESGVLETYAMGLATEQEAKLVAEMIVRHPEVKAELAAIEASLETFDQKNAVAPPAHLKAEILSKIKGVSGSGSKVSGAGERENGGKIVSLNGTTNGEVKQNNFYKYAAAVALILCIGTTWYALALRNTLRAELEGFEATRAYTDSLNKSFEEVYQAYQEQQREIDDMSQEITILKTSGMKSIELAGMEVAPDAKAMAYANTKTGEVYLEIMNLPAAPDGMQYQFWGIVDSKPVSAGMIPLTGDTAGIHPMTTVANASAYAISLEPMGGSEQPTGKIYVMGQP